MHTSPTAHPVQSPVGARTPGPQLGPAAPVRLRGRRGPSRCSCAREACTTATRATPRKPPAWFVHTAWRVHRALHELSGGRFLWTTRNKRGWGTMHLTATGHRTGQARSVIIGYIEDGPNLVSLAMNGWDEGDPAWWRNLLAHPEATIRRSQQTGQRVRARLAVGEERERLWRRWVDTDPGLTAHAPHRRTETPVVVFEPVG